MALGLGSLAGLSAVIAWALWGASAQPAWMVATAFALWLLSTAMAWRFVSALPCGMLSWDGQTWTLHDERRGVQWGSLSVSLDLQRRIAVRLVAADGSCRWIWLEQRRDSARWGDLRRAVYSRPGHGVADASRQASKGVGPV
ncbi:MAG: hypothetical protein RBS27_10505 [Giesbergeria sp.]|nr:hypothetical protein [Giesbergeria sp.]